MKKTTFMWVFAIAIILINLFMVMFADNNISLLKGLLIVASFIVANMWLVGAFIIDQLESKNG